MSRFCKPMGLYVTYLDCMECEEKECMKGGESVKTIRLPLMIGDTVFLVYRAKREGNAEDIVLKCKVDEIRMYTDRVKYIAKLIKVVTKNKPDERMEKYITTFGFENANINTGKHCFGMRQFPVFTTKELCIGWLRN